MTSGLEHADQRWSAWDWTWLHTAAAPAPAVLLDVRSVCFSRSQDARSPDLARAAALAGSRPSSILRQTCIAGPGRAHLCGDGRRHCRALRRAPEPDGACSGRPHWRSSCQQVCHSFLLLLARALVRSPCGFPADLLLSQSRSCRVQHAPSTAEVASLCMLSHQCQLKCHESVSCRVVLTTVRESSSMGAAFLAAAAENAKRKQHQA